MLLIEEKSMGENKNVSMKNASIFYFCKIKK